MTLRPAVLVLPTLVLGVLAATASGSQASGADDEYWIYVGTYTGAKSKGIYAFRFHPASGRVTPAGLMAETPNPSFLAVHPSGKYVYAVSEIADYSGQKSGAVSAFAADAKTGRLTLLNSVPSRGPGPCHLAVEKTGKTLLVANYGGGSVAALPIRPDGFLAEATAFIQHRGSSVNPRRQEGPHAHSINPSPDNRYAVVADLGLDKVLIYRLDAARSLLSNHEPGFVPVKPGAGPRHFAFHPTGKYGYVINELQSTVTAFAYDAGRGALSELQTITTLPGEFTSENSTAEVVVHPSGRFLYGSNRGHDSIAVFTIDPARGTLTAAGHTSTQGSTPRNFAIDPTGGWLFAANQRSDNIVVFRIDQKTGALAAAGQKLEAGSPVCVRFLRAQ
jgi:6-phosphogluconolactonase